MPYPTQVARIYPESAILTGSQAESSAPVFHQFSVPVQCQPFPGECDL